MAKFDREKFNTDPKHEEERNAFDQMVEDATVRIIKKKEAANPKPKEDENIFDALAKWMSGN